jgi:hypothetical protein
LLYALLGSAAMLALCWLVTLRLPLRAEAAPSHMA